MHTTTAVPILPSPVIQDHSNRFYLAMGGLMLTIVFTAFSTRYFGRAFTDAPPLPVFVHVHALLFTAWLLLFVIQANLVRSGWVNYHRQLGVGGMVLAAAITIVGVYSAIEGARRGHNPGRFPNALAFMIVSLGDMVLFAGFVAAALYFRRRREFHKRLMLLATIGGFMWPAIVRLPFIAGKFPLMLAVAAVIVLIAPLKDFLTQRRVHPIDVCGALIVVASAPLRRVIGATDGWQRFASWLVG